MKDFSCIKYWTTKFSFLYLLIIFSLVFSPVIEAKEKPGKLPCFQIDVPAYWMQYQSGSGEWYYRTYLPGGASIWLIVLVYKVDFSAPQKKAEYIKLTGSSYDGSDWLTGGIPIRTKSGAVWDCFKGIFPTGRDHITYSINIPGTDGHALTATAFILGAETFLKGKWSKQNTEFFRNILSSIRITNNFNKCKPEKTGAIISMPNSLANLAMSGKRGYLGAELNGTKIAKIAPGSPCIDAGIQKGDRILQADSWPIKNHTSFLQVLYWKNIGDLFKLQISRRGKSFVTDVSLVGFEDLQQKSDLQDSKTNVNQYNKPDIPPKPGLAPSQEISSLRIQGIKLEPAPVIGGEKFTFIVELKVNEADKSKSQIEVEMEHEILQDGKVLYTGKPEQIRVPNGAPYRLKKSLNATRQSGLYEIRVNIIYGDLKKTISSSLEIK